MSNKPPKPTYWEQRAEQKEKLIQGHTTKAVQSIANAYDKANSEITAEVKRIFETYKNEHGLTDEEARQLISHTETKELIQYLKFKLNTIADERIRKDILNRINAVSYAARITRQEALSERVGAIFKQTADIELGTDKSVLGNAYKESYYRTMFDCQQGFGIGADFALIPEKALKTVLESKFMGKNFSERVWINTNALAKKLKTVLSAGIATGASIEKMSNDIADLALQGKMMATRLIRTETTFYMGQGELKAYAEFGIDKYKYLATLDSRTSPMCAELDGDVFNVADAVPGENYPPLHAWCRSTTIAYFDDDAGTRIARDKDGKTYKVPSDMTYDEWKEKYVADAISKSDKEQFEKYKAIFKNDFPKTLEEFYNIKYNNSDKWSEFKTQKQDRINSMTFNDMEMLIGKLSDKETRIWYDYQDRLIPSLIDRSLTTEQQAIQAHKMRNDNRTHARELMKNQKLRQELDVEYPNISFEDTILKKMQSKGMTRKQAIEDIIKTAATPNKLVNKKFGLE